MMYGGAPDPGMPYVPREYVPGSPYVTIPGATVASGTLVLYDPSQPAKAAALRELLQLITTKHLSFRFHLANLAVHEILLRTSRKVGEIKAYDADGNVACLGSKIYVATAGTNATSRERAAGVAKITAKFRECLGDERETPMWITADGWSHIYYVGPRVAIEEPDDVDCPVADPAGCNVAATAEPKREVTVAARIDEYGQLHLRMSIDGVHLREISMHGHSITFTEKI